MSKTEFKAHALEVFREIEASGEPVVITDRGRPALEIRKLKQDAGDPLLLLRDSVAKYDAPTAPVGEDDWNEA
ncbi:MAG: type II toxin-antitoxin system Phd/YefM family antitoxin [Pseudomonadota bacterium]|nr:type II toxin-antitoxin system Phd/YefM family antitoxin [Pseudomonadota bacterium]